MINKGLILLLAFCVTAAVSSTISPARRVLAQISDPSPGIVPLNNSEVTGGFIATAYLNYDTTNGFAKESTTVMIALYSSTSVISNGCLNFSNYDPSKYSTSLSDSKADKNYVNFEADGKYFDTINLWLDYPNWSLKANGLLATDCSTDADPSTMVNITGMVAMGFSTASVNNYVGQTIQFSVFVDQTASYGQLSFDLNYNKALNQTPEVTISTTADWRMSNINIVQFDRENHDPKEISVDSYGMLFDLNSDAIGFPDDSFDDFISGLESAASKLDCTSDTYFPNCTYNGTLDDLPTVQIITPNGTLNLYPSIYVANYSLYPANATVIGNITLNFKSISSSLEGPNYVTDEFSEFIILNKHVLSYYYTVFTQDTGAQTGTVMMFQANHNIDSSIDPPNMNGNGVSIFVIAGAIVGGLLFMTLLCCGISKCIKKRKLDRMNKERNFLYNGDGSYLFAAGL